MPHTLHIFNPWHDEALAAHVQHYSPSLAGRRLAHALAELPRIWADSEDECLQIPESGSVKTLSPPDWEQISRIEPWGWDAHVVEILQRLGAPSRLLPSQEQLAVLRHLSSRVNVSELLAQDTEQALTPRPGIAAFKSHFCHTMDEVQMVLEHLHGHAMLKSPWSSSGRGVFPVKGTLDAVAEARVQKTLQQYGGIEVQSLHSVVGNFALEYQALPSGVVEYEGMSLFHAAPGGAYLGNLVAHPDRIEHAWQQSLMPYASSWGIAESDIIALLHHLQTSLALLLTRWLSGRYVGPLGVDMLITPKGLHPCVEINLRRTMGHVAVALGHRQLVTAPLRLLQISLDGWHLSSLIAEDEK